jgi:hypothetical protein
MRARRWALLLLLPCACLDIDTDPCAAVECAEGEACVALARGPICTCDADHERVGDTCVLLDAGEGEGE